MTQISEGYYRFKPFLLIQLQGPNRGRSNH